MSRARSAGIGVVASPACAIDFVAAASSSEAASFLRSPKTMAALSVGPRVRPSARVTRRENPGASRRGASGLSSIGDSVCDPGPTSDSGGLCTILARLDPAERAGPPP